MSYNEVFHVGEIDLNNLNSRPVVGMSLEGNGLSVSHHPEEWTQIARLGGKSTYRLTKDDARFFESDSNNVETAVSWCLENEYLKRATKYRAYQEDEDGNESYMELDEREDAENESEDVRSISGYKFTKKGTAYWKAFFSNKIDHALAESFALIFYAENHGYDGVWWNEELDPEGLSAPRGVIFQNKLLEWKIEKV